MQKVFEVGANNANSLGQSKVLLRSIMPAGDLQR